MELIGLTRAVALTTLTFTLSATPTWSQTNQNSFTCSSTSKPGCIKQIPTPLGLTPEPGKYQKTNTGESNSLPPTVQISHSDREALTIKNSQVVSQRPPILYSQGRSNRALAEAYNNRGNVYYNQEKWDLALADYNKAIKLNPNFAIAYNNRGLVYEYQEKWDLALADYNKAIELNPNYADPYRNRGDVHLNQQKWDLALADYTQAIRLNRNDAFTYNNRGLVYANQQKWDLALADYTQAIKLNPNFAEAYYNRGLVYENQEKWDLALADYNKAIAIRLNE